MTPLYAQDDDSLPVYDHLTAVKDWLNTSRALTPDDLKGRVLLVDFWTSGCINCMHVIPKLQTLEKEFGDKLTVIGVHSAKFATESDSDTIIDTIQKFGIHHPVVNDQDFLVWNAFGIDAWPTLLLIGPDGLLKQVYKGEGDISDMRGDIRKLIQRNQGRLNTSPLPIALEEDKMPATILRYPTKLSAIDDRTLVIDDSGHHRILVVDLKTSKIIQTIGDGRQGYKNGEFTEAEFNNPQGVLADGDLIYVADTGNHRLRLIDLKKKEVTTIAGTGERGGSILLGSHDAMSTALASPWDLAFYPDHDHIAIANAGSHQIWSYDRKGKTLSIIVGNGHEDIVDGAWPFNALAQTSGLSVADGKLYFVDPESSSLRVFDGKTVTTLIGTGLFDFGLKDGDKDGALMQHATGLYADGDKIYVADTYNDKIRLYKNKHLSTLPLDGLKGPNAILKIGDVFYIADTDNHRIVTMNGKGKDKAILDVMPMDKPVKYQKDLPKVMNFHENKLAASADVQIDLPKGWHINEQAPSYLALFDEDKQVVAQYKYDDMKSGKVSLPKLQTGKTYILQGILYYCKTEAGSQCLIRGVQADLHTDGAKGNDTVTLDLPTDIE